MECYKHESKEDETPKRSTLLHRTQIIFLLRNPLAEEPNIDELTTNAYEGDLALQSCLPSHPPTTSIILAFLLSSSPLFSIPNLYQIPTAFAQTPEILIQVSSAKSHYQVGEIAQLDITVTNNMADPTTCYFGLSMRDPEGRVERYDSQIGLTKPIAVLASLESTQFSAEWRIISNEYDDDVPEGPYDVAINCWKDESFSNRHTDNLEFERIFRVVDDDDRDSPRTFLEFFITLHSKNVFQRDQVISFIVEVENKREETADCHLGLSIRDPTGEFSIYDSQIILSSTSLVLEAGEKKSFSVEWEIPSQAPEGTYDVAVNCWLNGSFLERFTDNLIWESLFRIGELDNS